MARSGTAFGVAAFMAACWAGGAPAALAEGEVERLAMTCAGCHGTDGASPGESIPIIGGQTEGYLLGALEDYVSQARDSYIMRQITAGFDAAELASLAAHFASLPWRSTETPFDEAAAAEGVDTAGTLCLACHGAEGEGSVIGPRLAGQPAFFLREAMAAYLDGRRGGEGAEIMQMILSDLAEEELDALAHHYSGLR